MNTSRESRPKNWKSKNNDPSEQSLLGLTKNIVFPLLIINSKVYYG